ncbi:hypothetical protein Vadar_018326 [Vaccinium darrowii]|uniref:Uncharacterized protein n=1 Tax=Vaccinium darrowii TaxID=229202 RepID=A0ACB7Z581_9ERIC|nr:hypothetical protein Vadar_018326 [Vaccinium darrowii]
MGFTAKAKSNGEGWGLCFFLVFFSDNEQQPPPTTINKNRREKQMVFIHDRLEKKIEVNEQVELHNNIKLKFIKGAKERRELYNKILDLKENIRVSSAGVGLSTLMRLAQELQWPWILKLLKMDN